EETLEHAQQIWRGGIPDRNVAACAACHAPNGAGIPGEFPRLRGQFPAYLAEQLRLFRDGDRQDDIMAAIASRMQEKDIEAIADYAAGLRDRKSTRLNSSHVSISYAVFCLKKKNTRNSSRARSHHRQRLCTNTTCLRSNHKPTKYCCRNYRYSR